MRGAGARRDRLVCLGAGGTRPGNAFDFGRFGALAFCVVSLAFATVGALVAARLPRNPIGWIFSLTGLATGAGILTYLYAHYALVDSSGSLSGGEAAAALQNLGLVPSSGLLGLALLLFPDGRLPSPRWRAVAALLVVGALCGAVGSFLYPGPASEPFASASNPFGVAGAAGLMAAIEGVGWVCMVAGVGFAVVAARRRLRHAVGVERQQLKWVGLGLAVGGLVVLVMASFFIWPTGHTEIRMMLIGLGFATFPMVTGVAVLRYRLYDIDVVINRALVYAALTAILASAYVASVLLLQLVLSGLTSDSGLAVAGSTLAVAAMFRPVRARIQALVDRRFYRSHYNAQRTLTAFSSRLRDEVELETLRSDLSGVVREALQPAHVSLWMRT